MKGNNKPYVKHNYIYFKRYLKNVKKHGPNLCEIYYLLNGLNVAFYVIEYQFGKNVDDDAMYLAGHSLYLIVGHVLLAIAAVYNKMLVG